MQNVTPRNGRCFAHRGGGFPFLEQMRILIGPTLMATESPTLQPMDASLPASATLEPRLFPTCSQPPKSLSGMGFQRKDINNAKSTAEVWLEKQYLL